MKRATSLGLRLATVRKLGVAGSQSQQWELLQDPNSGEAPSYLPEEREKRGVCLLKGRL